MDFKTHPYYDESKDRMDWLRLSASEQYDDDLISIVEALFSHKQWLLERSEMEFRSMADDEYLMERPIAEFESVLFRPVGSSGYQAYIQFRFYEKESENTSHFDFWWCMFNCPYAVPPYLANRLFIGSIGAGWALD